MNKILGIILTVAISAVITLGTICLLDKWAAAIATQEGDAAAMDKKQTIEEDHTPLELHVWKTELNQHEPGAKLDKGKPRADLLQDFGLALLEVAKVCGYGAGEYSVGGWQLVENGIERYSSELIRHWLSEKKEKNDKESGLKHAAHLAWNALARLELMIREEERKEHAE